MPSVGAPYADKERRWFRGEPVSNSFNAILAKSTRQYKSREETEMVPLLEFLLVGTKSNIYQVTIIMQSRASFWLTL